MARDLAGSEDFLRIALIAVPPYGRGPVSENSPCTLGRLADVKEWFVTTPAVALLANAKVTSAWEAHAPDFEAIVGEIALSEQKTARSPDFQVNINPSSNALMKGSGHCDSVTRKQELTLSGPGLAGVEPVRHEDRTRYILG
jgi:hypothetical protein